jgi:fructokinase
MVIAFGEVLWDLLPTGAVMGGAPANFAFRLQEAGTEAHLVSKVGKDELGDKLLVQLRENGLNLDYVQVAEDTPTGTVDVEIGPAGDAHYTIKPGVAYDFIDQEDRLIDLAKRCDAIYFGTLIQRADVSRETLYRMLEEASNAWRIVDINLRKDCYTKETIRKSFELSNVLKLNQHEVKEVGDMFGLAQDTNRFFASKLIEKFDFNIVLMTLGKGGVLAFGKDGEEMFVPGYDVEVVDTVGAGDSFIAGFVHKLLAGENLQTCCEFGNLLGAMVAARSGGMPTLNPDEVEEFAGDAFRTSRDVSDS